MIDDFYNDLENSFFSDFTDNCLIEKNNENIKILFFYNNKNYQQEFYTVHQSEIKILMKETDFINNNILKNDILLIKNVNYLVESIEQRARGIKQIFLIYKEDN